jgi:hypothetical protein
MLPFGVTIPATVTQRMKIPEGLMNHPVHGKRIVMIVKDKFLWDVKRSVSIEKGKI